HPITATRRALEKVFHRMGFDVLDGPHVEVEDYNFDRLNFEPEHPARDMQDTFFVAPPEGTPSDLPWDPARSFVLRTHTSPVQVRTMLTSKPPIRIVAPGTVFRRDDDPTHSPMFNQIEGLYIDRGVTMADLKATLYRFVAAFFGEGLQVRFRPSFFPFVEPGAEFDMQCPFCRGTDGVSSGCGLCKRTGWIELGGSGMVHPAVFERCGIDAEVYTGWAFGFGIDRMAMLRYGVPNLKHFFEGDLRVLEQFPC
ncbi:MAG: phenylalanine--tRNA ligase subunit alpha, partial [Myxococcales bacterium]|nr:phenylalanine--tRNA ligase subunit alpha [Myxococcales bacterium]